MKKIVAAAFLLVIGAEALALAGPDRGLILLFAGVAVALSVLAVRWYLTREGRAEEEPAIDDAAESLRRWMSRTEVLVSRAEATRTEWDRHLRPMLARQFEMATGQKRTKDRAAYHASGRMLFGSELWQWVDPENVARDGRSESAPGREALDEILQRLERI
ncbi:hypothetical protein [Mycobacterium deserti]|uniref:Uncharacterized protein n=1 Tax=Mycobacterium deserti TaxID=2978347 RepID=A0ABT2MHG7_9MYCO|nr:hypothetical protein [Mycobacterium deserti]MCT7661436.1 hypothetical protein [Mycobacterium deserti]